MALCALDEAMSECSTLSNVGQCSTSVMSWITWRRNENHSNRETNLRAMRTLSNGMLEPRPARSDRYTEDEAIEEGDGPPRAKRCVEADQGGVEDHVGAPAHVGTTTQ